MTLVKAVLPIWIGLIAVMPALAQSPTSAEEKYRICQALRMANQDGISGKYMLEAMLTRRGQPKYLAKVIMNDVKPMCPKVF